MKNQEIVAALRAIAAVQITLKAERMRAASIHPVPWEGLDWMPDEDPITALAQAQPRINRAHSLKE